MPSVCIQNPTATELTFTCVLGATGILLHLCAYSGSVDFIKVVEIRFDASLSAQLCAFQNALSIYVADMIYCGMEVNAT